MTLEKVFKKFLELKDDNSFSIWNEEYQNGFKIDYRPDLQVVLYGWLVRNGEIDNVTFDELYHLEKATSREEIINIVKKDLEEYLSYCENSFDEDFEIITWW